MKLWWFITCALGFGSTPAVCWFSGKFWDVHDYHERAGGDGKPTHFYTYRCHCCGRMFQI